VRKLLWERVSAEQISRMLIDRDTDELERMLLGGVELVARAGGGGDAAEPPGPDTSVAELWNRVWNHANGPRGPIERALIVWVSVRTRHQSIRRRRSSPVAASRPIIALLGSGTADQVSELPVMVKAPWVVGWTFWPL
jgi:hypothetical protein